jgi:hypothetical protein
MMEGMAQPTQSLIPAGLRFILPKPQRLGRLVL